jgi:hypothetical protein
MIVRISVAAPRVHTATGDTQPLRPHGVTPACASCTSPSLAVLIGVAFLAGALFVIHPAIGLGGIGLLVAMLWKIDGQAVVP